MKTKNMPQWERALQGETERLIKTGKMPTLEEVCAAVLETRRGYASQIRRASA